MRKAVPIAGTIGFAASAMAVVLWTFEQITGRLFFEFLTIPFKLVLLATPLFFVSDLSSFLHRRPYPHRGYALRDAGVPPLARRVRTTFQQWCLPMVLSGNALAP